MRYNAATNTQTVFVNFVSKTFRSINQSVFNNGLMKANGNVPVYTSCNHATLDYLSLAPDLDWNVSPT